MAMIDLVKWDPSTHEPWGPKVKVKHNPAETLYAARFPETNLSTFTQLIVAESQEAVLFSKGRMIGKFGPGKHTLNTENIPILRSLFGLPFGGNNPFTAEVWFVNKLMPLNIDWDIDSMRFHDPDYKTMVPLMARGRYGLKVTDAERFLVKLVGTSIEYTAEMLTNHFKGALVSKTKSILLQAMQSGQIGVKNIGAYLDPLSQALHATMLSFWEDYGFTLIGLYITSIDIDERTPDGRKILEAMAQQSAQSIAGYTWQQNQGFEVAKDALNSNTDMGLLGVLLVSGGMGGSNVGNAMMQPQTPSANMTPNASGQFAAPAPAVRDVFCSNCSKKYPNSSKFCPHCGNPYFPCPRCGADNDEKATRCTVCGQQFGSQNQAPIGANICSRCKSAIPVGALFCPTCGMKA